ncbi:hypothetical protein EVAR_101764_1 [Eumeta japonica]|uniref:Uncharacterized protein n=1 Tax=Eumeta variegata TaxID=151549 RepID=A0A4C1SN85_EUMVA|nr:hypothetical protein EVAR_101764_1 [Eumeta japonica]
MFTASNDIAREWSLSQPASAERSVRIRLSCATHQRESISKFQGGRYFRLLVLSEILFKHPKCAAVYFVLAGTASKAPRCTSIITVAPASGAPAPSTRGAAGAGNTAIRFRNTAHFRRLPIAAF